MVIGKHFSKYYLKYIVTFIIGIIALVVVDYAQLEIPKVIGQIVDGMTLGSAGDLEALTKDDLSAFCKKLIVIALIVFGGRFLWRICIFGNGVKIENDIRNEMFEHMVGLSPTYFSTTKTGALMALYTNDLGTIRRSFGSGTLMLVDAISLGVVALIKMIKLNAKLTLLMIGLLFVVSGFTMVFERRIERKSKLNLEAYDRLSDYVQEDYMGIHVIKAYVKEKLKEFIFRKYNQDNVDTCLNYAKDSLFLDAVIDGFLEITMFGVLFGGGLIIFNNQMNAVESTFTVGKLSEFYAYFDNLIWPIMAIGSLVNLRGQSRAAEHRVAALLDEEYTINDNLVTEKELTVEDIKGNIKFDDLTWRYPTSNHDNLINVSFDIKAGELVGIMGATGCGKSTITDILLRLYNVEEGKVFIDGHDIMHMPVKLVRDAIAYVPQESFLFKQTIAENIAFSSDTVDIDKVKESAKNSDIAKDIEEFKDGYDTIVGERGVTVSGGQKQRIAIARALIKDSPILIMDDSLSAVDTITERAILKTLRELRKDKTTIIIAHRITTLETLDKIIVMSKRVIDHIGTHEELLESCSIYKNEVKLQELESELGGNK